MRYPEPRLAISYPRRLVRSFSRQASPRVQVALSQMSLSVIEFPLSRPSTADQVAIFLDSFHRRLSHSHAFHRSVSFTLPQVYFARWPSFPHVAAASAVTVRFRSLVFVEATPFAIRVGRALFQELSSMPSSSALLSTPVQSFEFSAFAVSRPSTTDQDDIRFLLTQRITVALATDLVQSASGVFCSFDRVSSTPPFA